MMVAERRPRQNRHHYVKNATLAKSVDGYSCKVYVRATPSTRT